MRAQLEASLEGASCSNLGAVEVSDKRPRTVGHRWRLGGCCAIDFSVARSADCRGFVYDEKQNLQFRSLVVLLVSKAAMVASGERRFSDSDPDVHCGIHARFGLRTALALISSF